MTTNLTEPGKSAYSLAEKIFPICRSLTGDGVRETLSIIQEQIPDLKVHEIPTGAKCFDWTIPKEWNIRDAYIQNSSGQKVVDFRENNLHVMGYSVPVSQKMNLEELASHLYSLPELPGAIPYITSYYKERWGFCLSHNDKVQLKEDTYFVHIDSELKDGHLTYGELLIPGDSKEEILLL